MLYISILYISMYLIYIYLWGLLCFQRVFTMIIIFSPKVSDFSQKTNLSMWISWYSKLKILSTNRDRWKYTYLMFNMVSVSVNFMLTYSLHLFLQVATSSYVLTVRGWKTRKVPTISIKWGILSSTVQNESIIFTAEKT